MRRKVVVKFFGEETEALTKFSRDVGLPPEELLKKCLWKCLREAYTVVTPEGDSADVGRSGGSSEEVSNSVAEATSSGSDSAPLANT